MKANLYFHADSLKYNGIDTEQEFNTKFVSLLSDLNEIRNQYGDENIIKVSTSLSDGTVPLYGQMNIYEIAERLEYEEKNFLFALMFNTSDTFDLSLAETESLCAYNETETECNTVVYLNKPLPGKPTYPIEYISFERYQILYGKESWHTLRRQIMGNHPGTPKDFMSECRIHFPNIVFHDNCETSIVGYLDFIPRKIVYYLSCMNDRLLGHMAITSITDENALLADFCGKYGFDEAGSRQSTPKKKFQYQYRFLKAGFDDRLENYKTITCDPHMKMSSCDSNCKNKQADFVGRIYFHFGDDEVAPGKILVGSIGPHIA